MTGKTLRLNPNHTWKAAPGHSICVLDRGTVRFEYPSHWNIEAKDGAIYLHDLPPGVESCDLGVSLFRIPGVDLSQLDLDQMLRQGLAGERAAYHESEIQHMAQADYEIAWLEQHSVDTQYQREARYRIALVRGPAVCLISYNYWASRAPELEPVWDVVLKSLIFGVPVEDPTRGPQVH